MQYQDLHQRYGTYIAKRVEQELHASEFTQVDIKELTQYLELRAVAAHKEYHLRLDDPFNKEQLGGTGSSRVIDLLHRRWREAEELAYLLIVAEDVGANSRMSMAS